MYDEKIENILNFLWIQIVAVLVIIIVGMFKLNILNLTLQITVLLLTCVTVKLMDEDIPFNRPVTIVVSIISIIIGFIIRDVVIVSLYGVLALNVIFFVIGDRTEKLENKMYNYLSNFAIVVCVCIMIGILSFINAGYIMNIKDVEKEFAKIHISDSISQIKKKLAVNGKVQEAVVNNSVKYIVFNYSSSKNYAINIGFNDKDDCVEKHIIYKPSEENKLFGSKNINFINFSNIIDIYNTKVPVTEKNKVNDVKTQVTIDELKENLGNVEKGVLIGESSLGFRYIFADKGKNYIIATVQGDIVKSIEGNVDSQEIKINK